LQLVEIVERERGPGVNCHQNVREALQGPGLLQAVKEPVAQVLTLQVIRVPPVQEKPVVLNVVGDVGP
jgi:hypothetical protein